MALVRTPTFLAVCLSDDTAVPLVRSQDACPEHPDAADVFEEVPVVTGHPYAPARLCMDCMADLDWLLHTVTLTAP